MLLMLMFPLLAVENLICLLLSTPRLPTEGVAPLTPNPMQSIRPLLLAIGAAATPHRHALLGVHRPSLPPLPKALLYPFLPRAAYPFEDVSQQLPMLLQLALRPPMIPLLPLMTRHLDPPQPSRQQRSGLMQLPTLLLPLGENVIELALMPHSFPLLLQQSLGMPLLPAARNLVQAGRP